MEAFSWLINIAIAVYLAIDAPKQGKSPVLWAIFGLVFGAITLGIYFIRTQRKLIGWIVLILSIIGYIVLFIISFIAAVLMLGF
ncbi:hypothetical protein [Pseudoneobacillus sp. C159]